MADSIIDLSLEGDYRRGEILFEGTPEEMVIKNKNSYTAKFLKMEME